MPPFDDTPLVTRALMALAVLGVCLLIPVALLWSVKGAVIGMAVFATAAAVARIAAPRQWSIGSRGRATDVTVLGVLAAALVFLALTTPLG